MKKKLIFAFVLALAVCLLLMPSAFADDVIIDVTDGENNDVASTTVTVTTGEDNQTSETATVKGSIQDVIDNTDVGDKLQGETYEVVANESSDDKGTVITVSGDVSGNITVNNERVITIDLNNNTLSCNGDNSIVVNENSTLTITNGTIYAPFVGFTSNGVLIFDGITFTGDADDQRADGPACKITGSGTVKFLNCTYGSGTINVGNKIQLNDSITAEITGGNYSSGTTFIETYNTSTLSINVPDSSSLYVSLNDSGKASIYGGHFCAAGTCEDNTVLNIYNGSIGVLAYEAGQINIYGGTYSNDGDNLFAEEALAGYSFTSNVLPYIDTDSYQYIKNADGSFTVSKIIAPVVDKAVEAAAPVVQAVVEKVNELVATAANDNTSYSIASNESFTIQLSYTDASTDEALPEIVSVSVNGVEVEFTIAADGSIVLAPEVLAALGPGTHVITIKTATGTVTLTIVITE